MGAGIANKLEINSTYLLFTNYSTISNLKVTVKAIMNYEKASAIPYSIKNLAINEKVIDLTAENTDEYFEDQLYYLCIYTDEKGDENQCIVWDDVVDSNNTTKTNTKYDYSLQLDIKSDLLSNLPTIEKSITTFITTTYGTNIVPTLVKNGELKSSVDEKILEHERNKELLNDALLLANKIAALKQIEDLINYFAKDDMYTKIEDISNSLSTIQNTISTISSMIS